MTYVVTLQGFTPAPRFDGLPFTSARIEEAALAVGPFAPIETIALLPVDADPSHPAARNLTTALATLAAGWYRVAFLDAAGDAQLTDPVFSSAATSALLCTVAQVRNALGDQNADSTVIQDGIAAFSQSIQLYCRRMWTPADTVARTLKFRYDGNGILDLGDDDVPVEIQAGSVTQIMLNSDLPAGTDALAQLVLSAGDTSNEADYRLYPLNKTESGTYTQVALPLALPKRVSGSLAPISLDAKQIEVSITAKFGAGVVPNDVNKACVREVANDYRNPEGFQSRQLGELGFSEEISDGAGGLPPLARGTRRLLWGYRTPVFA